MSRKISMYCPPSPISAKEKFRRRPVQKNATFSLAAQKIPGYINIKKVYAGTSEMQQPQSFNNRGGLSPRECFFRQPKGPLLRRVPFGCRLWRTLWCLVLKMIEFHKMRIETASVQDAEEILDLQKKSFLAQAHIYDNYSLPPLVQTIDSMRQELARKSFLKAVFNNQLIASVKFQQMGNLVHIERLIVHPAFQNQGVGTYLMRMLEDKFHCGVTFQLLTGEKSKRNVSAN